MSKAKPSVSKEDLEMQERFTKLYGTFGTLQADQPQVPLIGNIQPQATNNNNADQTPKQTKTDKSGGGGQRDKADAMDFPSVPTVHPEEEEEENITPAEIELMKHTTEITDKVEHQKKERKDNKKKKASAV